METWNFLGAINGIYRVNEEAQEYNIILTLLVYTNEYRDKLKIEYTEIEYVVNLEKPIKVKKGEILLRETDQEESKVITTNFNNILVKTLVLNKYLDYFGKSLNYQRVY